MTDTTEYDGIPDDEIWNIDFTDLEFKKEIARGSFGKVYIGLYLGVDVAIKQILRHNDPAYMKYIEREICVLKGIRHPYIVGFCGVCLHESGLYIVTEWVEGGDVRTLLKTSKPDWSRRIQIASELAKSMYYLHTKKIIHRDLKSKNILLAGDNHIRLCDFGFARISDFGTNRPMTICGTPGYVAPEVMLGMDYDYSCDVFSYGNVLAELITLQRPAREFWNRSADDNYQLDYDELPKIAPKDTPPRFLQLALKCVKYSPLDRPDFTTIMKEIKEIEKTLPAPRDRSNSNFLATTPSPTSSPRFRMATMRGSLDAIDDNNNTNNNNNGKNEDVTQIQRIVSQRLSLSSTERIISEKHLVKMVHRGTTPEYFDPEYLEDLLLFYPCFTTPLNLMDVLMDRYRNPEGLPNANSTGNTDVKKTQVTRMRVIVLLKTWIEKYGDDFNEPGMVNLINQFDKLTDSNKDPFSISKYLAKNNANKQTPSRLIPDKSISKKTLDPNLLLNVLSAIDIARQITYVDIHLYKNIHPREFIKEAWRHNNFNNLRALKERSEELARWTATAILKVENREQRVNMIQKFIEVAQACLTLKNYMGMSSIVAGLTHPSIERLNITFQGLKPAFVTSFKSMKDLLTKDNNYKNYKAKIEATTPPLVLYLEPFLEEITYIDESSQDIGKGGIINFTKHRQMGRITRFLLQYQHSNFPEIKPIDTILDLLLKTTILPEDMLKKQSLLVEPPSSFIK